MDNHTTNLSRYRLGDLLEIPAIQKVADSHFSTTGIPIGLIDAADGSVLVEAGWQDICLNYHREHPEARKSCQECESFMKARSDKMDIREYRCSNGLWHIGIPICVLEKQRGTLFLGQFFYEDTLPDYQFFYDQCKKYGFDWESYKRALAKVPVLSRDKKEDIIEYDIAFARFISSLAEKSLQLKIGEEKLKDAFFSLQESENTFRTIFENAAQGKAITTLDGQFLRVNNSLCQVSGYTSEELLTKKWQDLILPDFIAPLKKHIDQLLRGQIQSFQHEVKFTHKNGQEIWLQNNVVLINDNAGDPQFLYTDVENITEKKQLARQLQQTQKMEALGTLAGGIAHDFNNMLSPILGFAELVKIRTADDPKSQEMLNQILACGIRAKELVKHIKIFSRKADAKNGAMQIIPILKENVKFLQTSISPDIEIRCHYPQEEPIIYADLTQVHQILMNLLTNGVQAMRENGGVLEIRLGTEKIETTDNPYSADLKTANYVKLEIKDSGQGIPEMIIDRIFEPFFTTKPRGEGTGLGLSQAYGLAKEMGGHISVESTTNIGTTFTLLIPEHGDAKPAHDDILSTGLVQGSGRILLVDDEKSILDWTSKILAECGYSVVAVNNAAEALAKFSNGPEEFDLVITDFSMPKMTGLELASMITGKRSDLPVLLCAGFSESLTPKKFKENGITSVLMKPVIASELSQRVDFCLSQKKQEK